MNNYVIPRMCISSTFPSFPLLVFATAVLPPCTVSPLLRWSFSGIIIFPIFSPSFSVLIAPPWAHAMERLNALDGDSLQSFWGLFELWLFFASAFSSLLLFSFLYHFSPIWQEDPCAACSSRTSQLYLLSLAKNHCLVIVYPASPLSFTCTPLAHLCLWLSSCSSTALGLLLESVGVDALCQVILSLGKSPTVHGKLALTCLCTGSDGWLRISILAVVGPMAHVFWCWVSCAAAQMKGGALCSDCD